QSTWLGVKQDKSALLKILSGLECLWILLIGYVFMVLLAENIFFGLFFTSIFLYPVHLVQFLCFKALYTQDDLTENYWTCDSCAREFDNELEAMKHERMCFAEATPLQLPVQPSDTLPPQPPVFASAWLPPSGLQGEEVVLAEFFGKRRECYNAAPNNEQLLDYLHNNRERFAISSYFEIPTAPASLLQQWALPPGLRGNVHLDATRQQIVETVVNSSPESNHVIIGEPGVGKTVLLFEVFDRLMANGLGGLLTTDSISEIHRRFGLRLFYDDIPENAALVQAMMKRGTRGVILTSREVDWKGLPTEFQAMFDRLTVPLFSSQEMSSLCEKMLGFSGLVYDEAAVNTLVNYAEGSPIYVWSMVRELLHKGQRRLSQEYIQENATRGMTNYVSLLLQRLLKEEGTFRSGGLHTLTSLVFLADYMEERTSHGYYFHTVASLLSEHTEKKLGDGMERGTFNQVLGYLSGEGGAVRFPHDTWVDVLRGSGAMNPFRAELEQIQEELIDSKLFLSVKETAVKRSWKTIVTRFQENPTRQKESFLALADTLMRNFTVSQLKKQDVDLNFMREVASTYS
ncbi:MAG: hypothetical protein AAEJ57_01775, partial [Opitutales bacterium]